jgi:hypothetical protein
MELVDFTEESLPHVLFSTSLHLLGARAVL